MVKLESVKVTGQASSSETQAKRKLLAEGGKTSRTRGIALASALAALYVASSVIPASAFIGGAGYITAGIIILPVIARILKPKEALVAAVIAPIGLLALQLSVIPVFGFYGMLIPASGIILGSLGVHRSALYPAVYIAFGALWYIVFSGGTLIWLIPYFLAVGWSLTDQIRPFRAGGKWHVVLHSLNATMCELVTMNIGSISLLRLPGELWLIIAPFMFIERAFAVVGSSFVLLALIRLKR